MARRSWIWLQIHFLNFWVLLLGKCICCIIWLWFCTKYLEELKLSKTNSKSKGKVRKSKEKYKNSWKPNSALPKEGTSPMDKAKADPVQLHNHRSWRDLLSWKERFQWVLQDAGKDRRGNRLRRFLGVTLGMSLKAFCMWHFCWGRTH